MLTRADLPAALQDPYALGLLIFVGSMLAAWFIWATSAALWARFGPVEQVEAIDLRPDGEKLLAALVRRGGLDGSDQ